MKTVFPAGKPATGENLVGRDREIKQISTLLTVGQSVVLISPRRYGKTSLILEILSRLRNEGYYTAHIDIFTVLSRRNLAEKITEKLLKNRKINNFIERTEKGITTLLKNIEFKQTIEEFEFILKYAEKDASDNELLDDAFDFPEKLGEKSKKGVIVAFDEFSELIKLDGPELLKWMRGKFQLHKNASYLFSGSQESTMNQLFLNRQNAFFRFGKTIHLNFPSIADLSVYIGKKFLEERIKISDKIIAEILSITKGHPYYTQGLCQELYINALFHNLEVTESDIPDALEAIILSEKSYFDEVWGKLLERKHQIQVIREIVSSGENLYSRRTLKGINLYRVLNDLEKSGIIKKQNNGVYQLRDPIFEHFVKGRLEGYLQ